MSKSTDALRPTTVPFTTDKVTAVFTHLDKPDTKFCDRGWYKIVFRVTLDEGKKLQSKLKAVLADWTRDLKKAGIEQAKTLNPVGGKLKTDDDGTECYWFEAKMRPSFKSRKSGDTIEQRPQVLDAQLKPMNELVGSGSTVKVSFRATAYNTPQATGITLRLNAVQVLELVRVGEQNDTGFGVEEGFATEPSEASEKTNSVATTLEAEPASATNF